MKNEIWINKQHKKQLCLKKIEQIYNKKVSITIENLLILSSDTDVETGNDFINDLLLMEKDGKKTKKARKINSDQRQKITQVVGGLVSFNYLKKKLELAQQEGACFYTDNIKAAFSINSNAVRKIRVLILKNWTEIILLQ